MLFRNYMKNVTLADEFGGADRRSNKELLNVSGLKDAPLITRALRVTSKNCTQFRSVMHGD